MKLDWIDGRLVASPTQKSKPRSELVKTWTKQTHHSTRKDALGDVSNTEVPGKQWLQLSSGQDRKLKNQESTGGATVSPVITVVAPAADSALRPTGADEPLPTITSQRTSQLKNSNRLSRWKGIYQMVRELDRGEACPLRRADQIGSLLIISMLLAAIMVWLTAAPAAPVAAPNPEFEDSMTVMVGTAGGVAILQKRRHADVFSTAGAIETILPWRPPPPLQPEAPLKTAPATKSGAELSEPQIVRMVASGLELPSGSLLPQPTESLLQLVAEPLTL